MGRLQRIGLDFMPLSVHIWGDDKIKHIGARFEERGELIVIKLLQAIYKDKGYYLEWNEDEATLFAKGAGKNISPGLVKDVVNELLKREFLDTIMHKQFSILTSYNIQRTYEKICKDSGRKGDFIKQEHRITPWMLTQRGITAEEIAKYTESIPKTAEVMPITAEVITQRKGKETKLKETKQQLPPPHDFFEQILKDQSFIESVMMLHKFDEKKLTQLLRKFFTSKKILQTDKWNDYFDCRGNFFNWLPIELSKEGNSNGKYTPPPTDPVYVSQVTKEQPLQDLKAITAEQREQARIELQEIIDADFKNYCENDQCVIRFAPMKMDFLRKYKIFEPTEEQRKYFNDLAVGERMRQLNLTYDPVTRITLKHYQDGRLPEGDTANLQAISKELALRHYFEIKKQELFPEPEPVEYSEDPSKENIV